MASGLLPTAALFESPAMNRLILSVCAAVAGGVAMYWLDPDTGRRRRARAADQIDSVASSARRFARLARRDAQQRSAGVAAEVHARLRDTAVDDATLAARARAHLGRLASHPHALKVEVSDGLITLFGPVLEREADALLTGARNVRGVVAVADGLTRYERADHVSALQGGRLKPGPSRWEFSQHNWSPAARVVGGAAGAVLCMLAWLRRGPLGVACGVAGAGLLARSFTNIELAELLRSGGPGVRVEKTIEIHAPVERVFDFWRRVEDFPRFMRHVQEVRGDAAATTHWRVDGVGGGAVEWDAQCTGLVENEVIGWATLPESTLQHAGVVCFEDRGDGTTLLHVSMRYQPPAGALGAGLLRLAGSDPKHRLDDDLMRVKTFLETGRAPYDAAARANERASTSAASA
jgi:uncharacterized membrane protein